MTEGDLVLRADHGEVVELTLNRPTSRNALSRAMLAALTAAIAELAGTPTRAIILGGAGEHFCAGHDLKELAALTDPADYRAVFDDCVNLMATLVEAPQPVIARVQGVATAAGCQLVAACDLAVAARDARFATPGVNLGLFCSTPMVALSRNLGRKQAMEMLLTGEPVDAERARQMGLINRVVETAELGDAARALAFKVAQKSEVAVRFGKAAFYQQLDMPVMEAYRFTAGIMVRNMLEAEAREGIDAFLAKRQPRWGAGR